MFDSINDAVNYLRDATGYDVTTVSEMGGDTHIVILVTPGQEKTRRARMAAELLKSVNRQRKEGGIQIYFRKDDKSTWPPDDTFIMVKKSGCLDFCCEGMTCVRSNFVRVNDCSSDLIDDEDLSCSLEDGDIYEIDEVDIC